MAKKVLKPSDVQDSITRIIRDENSRSVTTVTRFNSEGKSDEKLKSKLSEDDTCAKRIKSGRKISYKVRMQRGGKLYDPGQESKSYGLKKRDRLTNEEMFSFKDVSPSAFDAYVKFLQTRYETYMISAEREAL